MSTGFAAIPLLKAAPEPDQVADRLAGGAVARARAGLMPRHVADDAVAGARRSRSRAQAPAIRWSPPRRPVAWPSGAFVRVDRLDDEARRGIERSAEFAAGIGSPVLTIHLFTPHDARGVPRRRRPRRGARSSAFLRFFADACLDRGVMPLIENVPPVLRMRTGGVFLSPVGRPLARPARVARARARAGLHARHLARGAVPQLRGRLPVAVRARLRRGAGARRATWRSSGPRARSRTSPTRTGCSARACRTAAASCELDPVVRRIGELVPLHGGGDQRARPRALAGHEGGLPRDGARAAPPPARPRGVGRRAACARRRFDWQRVLRRRDPVPSVLELQELFGGRRVLITGGGGSIGGSLATLLGGFRPERSRCSTATRPRSPPTAARATPRALERIDARALRHPRRRPRWRRSSRRARPDVVFHLAAYKHVDWAEALPRGVRGQQPARQLERAARGRDGRRGHRGRRVHRQGRARRQLLRPHQALHGAARRRTPRSARARAAPPCAS